MGMDFKLVLYARDAELANRAAEAAFGRVKQLNGILSDYDPRSELSRLSETAGQNRWTPISPELWLVLARAQELAQRTEGAFDVTVGPLTRLWRRSRRQGELPSAERLAQARAAVGYHFLQLDCLRRAARLARAGMRLDLGGIAAGYAADEALRVLREHGVSRALIDASGDIVAGEPPPHHDAWRVALPELVDLDGGQHGKPAYIALKNAAVANSGDTAQFVEIDGKRYSHIVDPKTGLGLQNRASVTVIAPDGITADSLATAVRVLGPTRGLQLVAKLPRIECLVVELVDERTTHHLSAGFRRRLIYGDNAVPRQEKSLSANKGARGTEDDHDGSAVHLPVEPPIAAPTPEPTAAPAGPPTAPSPAPPMFEPTLAPGLP